MNEQKFKIGDRVVVVTPLLGRGFPVGRTAVVTGYTPDLGDYKITNVEGEEAFVDPMDLAPESYFKRPGPVLNFDEYQEKVLKHAFYPNRGENLPYATLGLAGEAGEVANVVKKIQRDDGGVITEEKRQKLKDELGDVLWYIGAAADELGFTLEEIARFNIEKLQKRHGTDGEGRVRGSSESSRSEFSDAFGSSYGVDLCPPRHIRSKPFLTPED